MSQTNITIPKLPEMTPDEDYFLLRKEGIGFIEKMGSVKWTDYNTHDPGITILESLCYAITDLAYRIGWDIKDLLADAEDQPFFTAREILTVNPWTPDDFRRLLIDLDMIRNAWMICKDCACEVKLDCIVPKGLYDILLELEAHDLYGDLNDSKIERTFYIEIDDRHQALTLEVRFPDWSLSDQTMYDAFLAGTTDPTNVVRTKFSRSKTANNVVTNDELHKYWRNVFYFTLEMEIDGTPVTIENISLRLFGDASVKNDTTVADLTELLTEESSDGFIQAYRNKRREAAIHVAEAKATLHTHRNLDEDLCTVSVINIEDVAACGDVEVAPDADIERVQAEIWFAIEQYFNPTVPFYTLAEMQDFGIPVEEIFDGPELSSGFILQEDLDASQLKRVLRVSDIINLLMDIDGVVAVSNMMLTKYDSEGNVVKGASDPTWSNGEPIFDANKISAHWLLFLTEQHLPRLYHNLSNFHFYKNGLPFSARQDEAYDTLIELRGAAERIKNKNAASDLPIPIGTVRSMTDVEPVQYGFPQTYGIGRFGLPSHVPPLRRAQARQLKAYLMVFEQILGNSFAQIAHLDDLFALRADVDRTYFYQVLNDSIITGYNDVVSGLTEPILGQMVETQPEFFERRNIFLDHIMARFGEQFGEYALLMTNWKGQTLGNQRLIEDKVSFLKAYPTISHDRAKAFNYTVEPVLPDNYPGIKKRVSLLLGFPNLHFVWNSTGSGPFTINDYDLVDGNDNVWFEGVVNVSAATLYEAKKLAYDAVLVRMTQSNAFQIVEAAGKFTPELVRPDTTVLGITPEQFDTEGEAQDLIDELIAWAANERSVVVEHLLLRPKFPGDALYPKCDPEADTDDCGCEDCDDCEDCADADPYSFRLTFVMPGWSAPYNENMELRDFANRTIQYETPSHLLGKTCWVGNDGFVENVCDPVIDEVSKLLEEKGLTSGGSRPTCLEAGECATNIYKAFSATFTEWYADKTLDYVETDWLASALHTLFDSIDPTSLTCTTDIVPLWNDIRAIYEKHFHFVALFGFQFERFENAWHKWLDVNSAFDWTEEKLHERVEAILNEGFISGNQSELCNCATNILSSYGATFSAWIESNIKSGRAFQDFSPFTPSPVTLCTDSNFKVDTLSLIEDLLAQRYGSYAEVSYWLWVVVHLLFDLRNTYPGATLHDCDDGSDLNPVRLGSTALGNYQSQN